MAPEHNIDPSLPPVPHNELERIAALHALGVLDTPAEQEFDDLARLAAAICGTPMSSVTLVDVNRQWFKAKFGLDGSEAPRDITFCAHAVAQDDLFIVEDAHEDERFRNNPFVTQEPNVRFYAGMPLTTDKGLNLGSLCVLDRVPRNLTDVQRDALQVLSRQVVMHLELRAKMKETKRAQVALAASEAKFRSTIEHLADGVCIVDAEKGRFLEANNAMLTMLGYTLDEFIALDPFDIVANETREQFGANIMAMVSELNASGTCDVGRRFYKKKDGTVITVRIRVSTLPECERPMHAVIVRDVTQEDRVQSALRNSEKRFRLFMDNSPMVAFMKDYSGRYTYVNEPLVRKFGFPKAAWIGRTDAEIFPTIFSSTWRENDLQVFESGQTLEFEETTPQPDGSVVHWSSFKFPFRDDDDSPMLAGFAVDVTEKVEVEHSLRQSEDKFRRVVEGLSEGVLLVDLNTMKVVQANGTALKMSGAEVVHMHGVNFFDLLSVDRAVLEAEVSSIADVGQTRLGRRQMFCRNGSLLDVDVSLSFVASGQSRMMSVVMRDMTEQRMYEDQLFEYQSGLEEANSKLRALAVTDALTGVSNRAAFDERVSEEHDRAVRHGHALSVVMIDVDHFKMFNDTFGHPAGDEVLRQVAETLKATARVGDFVARYGGEEFAMILPDTDYSGSMVLAERCRRAIASRAWPNRAISVSVGVATITVGSSPKSIVKRADVALYRSKSQGRNRVTHAQTIPEDVAA